MSSNTNFVQLKLALAATAAQTTLTVYVPSAPFQLPAANGTLTLLDVPGAPTKAEIVGYTTVTNNGDGTATLGGVTRAKESTTAQAWAVNTTLLQALTAADYAADLAAKQDAIGAGTTAQFWRGDKTWQDLAATVRAVALTGIILTSNAAITATDTVLSALGKLQKQITDLGSSKLDSSSFTFANLGSKPTTLAGYGITDAAASGHTHAYAPLTGAGTSGTWGISITGSAGSLGGFAAGGLQEIGRYLDFHATNNGFDFDVRLDAQAGASSGAGVLAVTAGGGLVCSGNLTAYSDIRLKTDIEVISDALARVLALRGVTYERIDSGQRQTGVIAQEVQAVLPEAVMVGEDENATLAVAYGNLAGLLIEAIKELDAKVEALKHGAA